MGFPNKNTGIGCHFLLQGIFPTQRLNSHLLHCRQILYLGSPLLVCLFLSFRLSEWLLNRYKLCLNIVSIMPTKYYPLPFWLFRSANPSWAQLHLFLWVLECVPIITDSMDMSLSKLQKMKDREVWHAAVHGVAKSWTWVIKKQLYNAFPRFFLRWLIAFCCLQPQVSWSSKNYGRSSVFTKSFLPARMLTSFY